jgi:hypothetical protein
MAEHSENREVPADDPSRLYRDPPIEQAKISEIPSLTDEQIAKWFTANPALLPYKRPMPDELRAHFESEIRSLASTVLTGLDNRKNHPTYGYTKAIIRDHYNRLAGAVGMYGILTEQYRVATLWQSTEFSSPVTAGTVRNALDRYDRMQDGVTE